MLLLCFHLGLHEPRALAKGPLPLEHASSQARVELDIVEPFGIERFEKLRFKRAKLVPKELERLEGTGVEGQLKSEALERALDVSRKPEKRRLV